METKILDMISQLTGISLNKEDLHKKISEVYLDSLLYVRLCVEIENMLDKEIPDDLLILDQQCTLIDFVKKIEQAA